MITNHFGEPTFPPPREGTGTGKKTRKTKGKLKKLRKQQAAMSQGTATQDGASEAVDRLGQVTSEATSKSEIPDTNGSGGDTIAETKDVEETQAKKPRVRENPWDSLMPSFRVTCHRHGENHNFDSMTAAANFGGAIYNYFKWNVKMTEFDIEVILGIEEHEVTVSIGLTKESLHRRNITHFGPTTLRPTIAYSMLR